MVLKEQINRVAIRGRKSDIPLSYPFSSSYPGSLLLGDVSARCWNGNNAAKPDHPGLQATIEHEDATSRPGNDALAWSSLNAI